MIVTRGIENPAFYCRAALKAGHNIATAFPISLWTSKELVDFVSCCAPGTTVSEIEQYFFKWRNWRLEKEKLKFRFIYFSGFRVIVSEKYLESVLYADYWMNGLFIKDLHILDITLKINLILWSLKCMIIFREEWMVSN